MSLTVEVAGFGICQALPSFTTFVVSVQQESFQPWTVYRRFQDFHALGGLMNTLHETPDLQMMDPDNFDLGYLEQCREALNIWLQNVVSNQLILRTQSMYQFLCSEANVAPPYLEMHWRAADDVDLEDMEMDDMYVV